MKAPAVHYTFTDDDLRIAYQDFGSGPPVLLCGWFFTHLEANWMFEPLRRMLERQAANTRLIMFDHRGEGLSDGFTELPSIDDRTLDVKAVMDAVGLEQANIHGEDVGAQVAIAFAARFPERVEKLSILNARVGRSKQTQARALELNPGFVEDPRHQPGKTEQRLIQADARGAYTTDDGRLYHSPSLVNHLDYMNDPRWLDFERAVGGRDVYKRQIQSIAGVDVAGLAQLVEAPTQIVHATGHRMFHIGYGRLLAELIPNATLIEYDGVDQEYWITDQWKEIIDYRIEWVTGHAVDEPVERGFAVVLFTDIVDSTKASLAAGDEAWRHQLEQHDRITSRVVTQHRGTLVKHTGDGLLATFPSPTAAMDAASTMRSDLAAVGIEIRAGLHAGEIEHRGDDVSGAVVNLTARVEAAADAGEVYVTKALHDMMLGSSHAFTPAGEHELKGFDGTFRLYRLKS